jgi:hypothetical protein
MDEQQVHDILTWHNARWDTPARARMLTKLNATYETEGVIVDGDPLALHRCCPSAPDCWRQAQDRLPRVFHPIKQPTKHGEGASIFWPWVGESYRPGGVCLVSLNINNDTRKDDGWWTIGVEYAIAETAIEVLEQGGHKPHGSWFAYRSMATALAALASLDGQKPIEQPTPQEAAIAYDRVARVQAVKCSPTRNSSRPTKAMRLNCPKRFACRELALLRPGVLVALGGDARAAIELLGKASWTEHGNQFHRGKITMAQSAIDVLALPHPASHGNTWATGQQELVASLHARPLHGPA